ncbi:cupin domain-containing protein [Streptomyces sp. NPDC020490]|uniref:cupin domain-containing protein n=1 Tax=Streptomyces sp. NPDC020490 TaxID=3365078 RepID=UPI00378A1021
MSLHASGDSVPRQTADMGTTSFTTQVVYGNSSSLMIATRPGGYHSLPHIHDCEQLNWLQSGDLWVFIEDRTFHLKAGDFLRIPASARHWSWNRSDEPCTLVEVHTPGLHADPLVESYAIGLHDDGETPEFLGSPINSFLPPESDFDPSVAESKVK